MELVTRLLGTVRAGADFATGQRMVDLTLPGWNQIVTCFRELQELRVAA